MSINYQGSSLLMRLAMAILFLSSGCAKQNILQNERLALTNDLSTLAVLATNIYYVSPTGLDTNPGTIELPFLTIQRAQAACVPGDIVYIRGGNYVMQAAQIARTETLYAIVTYLDKSGTASARIQYLAYPGEKPVFDFSNVTPADKRITAFMVKGSFITIKGLDVKGVKVTITAHTQSECFRNEGSNNIYEALKMHDGMANGFYLTKGGNNLILNCDAWNNWDNVSENQKGGNVDGFGCHPNNDGVGYTGNVFRGCRAWLNSDDGFDCINAFESITFENCWAFNNGYSSAMASLGDGNGFKIGGFGVTNFTNLPAVIPRHNVRFCLAVNNKSSGFYANHHLGGSNWYNNTALKNAVNFNMLNRSSDYASDVAGYGHNLNNNLGYRARSTELSNLNLTLSTTSNNYFQLSTITVNDSDFLSQTESLLTQGRHSDFTLPTNDFMRLVSGSDIINKGVNLGFTFTGVSPDLGCFEFGINKSPIPSGPVAP